MKNILSVVTPPLHSCCCKCELQVNWDISVISGAENESGFVLQKLTRSLEPTDALAVDDYKSIAYYEAWKVENGRVATEDKGDKCDDMFSIGAGIASEFVRSLDTKGRITFVGEVYWVPSGTDLYRAIDHWPRGRVKEAGGLRATYDMFEVEKEYRHFVREPFRHEWDLIGTDNIYLGAKEILFDLCKKSSDRDHGILLANAEFMLEKYPDIADRIINEWEREKKYKK